MAVKFLNSRVVTKRAEDGGRSVRITTRNHAAVAVWLGDALIRWEGGDHNAFKGPKLKFKTPKGPRVAQVDDVIVKHGTRRNGGKVTFTVVKAS